MPLSPLNFKPLNQTGSGTGGYGAPTLPSNVAAIVGSAAPGLNGLQNRAVDYVTRLMSGQLSGETQDAIQDAAAGQAVSSGMPGSSRTGGTLIGNRVLRDIGLTSEGQQAQGFGDFLQLLAPSVASGEAALNRAQSGSQFDREFGLRGRQFDEQAAAQAEAQRLARERMALEVRRYNDSTGGGLAGKGAFFEGKWWPNGTAFFTSPRGQTRMGLAGSF